MVRKLVVVAVVAVLAALPAGAFAGQDFKNHGQCVSACVQDLGVEKNKECTAMCKAGTYGQDPAPVEEGLPLGAPCSPVYDLCAGALTCQPIMPGWPIYRCR